MNKILIFHKMAAFQKEISIFYKNFHLKLFIKWKIFIGEKNPSINY